MMKEPRTLREALAAQVLGEIDDLVVRVEALPAKVLNIEVQLKATTNALNEAADKYRLAVTSFTDQAKAELSEHLQRKAAEVVSRTVEEQRIAMQEAACHVFKLQATEQVSSLADALRAVTGEFKRATRMRMIENGVVALIASGLTAVMVYGLLR